MNFFSVNPNGGIPQRHCSYNLCVLSVVVCLHQPSLYGTRSGISPKLQVRKFYEPRCEKSGFLAHLSQRLIGELIVYSCSGVRPSVVRRRRTLSSTISNIFFSETAGPIKAKFYLEPPWVGGTIFCSRHLGHMTKMAATPIYGKNPSKIFFSRTGRRIFTKLGM